MSLTPPRTLRAVAPVPGLPVNRGRVLRAVLSTVADANTSDNEAYYAGFGDTSGGGLRAGRYESIATAGGQVLILHRLAYVRGVRVTGAVLVDGSEIQGLVRVHAPGQPPGRVAFSGRRIVARLGHRTLRTTVGHLIRTRLALPVAHAAFRRP
jgi:hypothetical protein